MRILILMIALVFAGCGGASDSSAEQKARQEGREIAEGLQDTMDEADNVEKVLEDKAASTAEAIEEADGS